MLSRVHWVRPELVAEVKFLTWTDDNLLRQVVYEGLREDKPAAEVRREVPHPKLPAAKARCPFAARTTNVTGAAVKIIAAPVVAAGEIDQFPANARRPCIARQFANLAGHLSAMVAVRKRGGSLITSGVTLRKRKNSRAGLTNHHSNPRPRRHYEGRNSHPTDQCALLPNAADNHLEYGQRPRCEGP